jgi:hypothetical protein
VRPARELSRWAAAALCVAAVAGCGDGPAGREEVVAGGGEVVAGGGEVVAGGGEVVAGGQVLSAEGPPEAAPETGASSAGGGGAALRGARAAAPERLLIPSLGVSSRLETLGLQPDGRLAPPRDPDRAGWWAGGPRPGRRGAAVIAGHVDSRTGPAVFAELARLRRGDGIVVVDRAGRRLRFAVQATQEYAKDAFPTQHVYGRTPRPTLRLITCSGTFDRGAGHYRSNLVVFATLRGTRGT